jgi:hypothetical protein
VLEYTLRGVNCKHSAEWRPREPEGGADLHYATCRGTGCMVQVACDGDTGYTTRMTLYPAGAGASSTEFSHAVAAAVERWNSGEEFKGVQAIPLPSGDDMDAGGFMLSVPAAISPSHEEHFAMVLEEFLDHIGGQRGEGPSWPSSLPAAIRMRYTLLAHAHALGQQQTQA